MEDARRSVICSAIAAATVFACAKGGFRCSLHRYIFQRRPLGPSLNLRMDDLAGHMLGSGEDVVPVAVQVPRPS